VFAGVVVSRSSVGKWFAQSRAVAYLVPGVCIFLLAILVTVSSSVSVKWQLAKHVFRVSQCIFCGLYYVLLITGSAAASSLSTNFNLPATDFLTHEANSSGIAFYVVYIYSA